MNHNVESNGSLPTGIGNSDDLFNRGVEHGMDLVFEPIKHTYKINGILVPGCTTITGMMPKPFLVQWAANKAVDHIQKHVYDDKWPAGVSDWDVILKEARKAWVTERDKASDYGTQAHSLCEQHIKGEKIDLTDKPKEVVNSYGLFMDWIGKHKVEWLHSEIVVGSEFWMCAGKFDAVAKVNGIVTLIDFKTSKGVYDEYHYQTAGYQLCYEEMKLKPKIEQRMILWIPKTGNKFKDVVAPKSFREDLTVFLALNRLYKALHGGTR